ncbi:hypothetical protein B0A77_05465 [Flavobacterium branchiophilum]|uniref:Uncharacterized protein n=1 Tax=Flavobacterium branchiophilum TaxID=55197 RepID=A0A2H3KCK4_9FLAO|nr:hypothetical protein B0A77_05465 [Flavobacterium branchiophilum]
MFFHVYFNINLFFLAFPYGSGFSLQSFFGYPFQLEVTAIHQQLITINQKPKKGFPLQSLMRPLHNRTNF